MTVKKILLVLSLALVPLAGYSQMFSVYNQPERISTNKTSFRIGTSLTDFTFQGSDPEDVAVELLELKVQDYRLTHLLEIDLPELRMVPFLI